MSLPIGLVNTSPSRFLLLSTLDSCAAVCSALSTSVDDLLLLLIAAECSSVHKAEHRGGCGQPEAIWVLGHGWDKEPGRRRPLWNKPRAPWGPDAVAAPGSKPRDRSPQASVLPPPAPGLVLRPQPRHRRRGMPQMPARQGRLRLPRKWLPGARHRSLPGLLDLHREVQPVREMHPRPRVRGDLRSRVGLPVLHGSPPFFLLRPADDEPTVGPLLGDCCGGAELLLSDQQRGVIDSPLPHLYFYLPSAVQTVRRYKKKKNNQRERELTSCHWTGVDPLDLYEFFSTTGPRRFPFGLGVMLGVIPRCFSPLEDWRFRSSSFPSDAMYLDLFWLLLKIRRALPSGCRRCCPVLVEYVPYIWRLLVWGILLVCVMSSLFDPSINGGFSQSRNWAPRYSLTIHVPDFDFCSFFSVLNFFGTSALKKEDIES